MSNTNYIPFGEEWKKEMEKLSKEDLINILAKEIKQRKYLQEAAGCRSSCMEYLKEAENEELTTENVVSLLKILGYDRKGNDLVLKKDFKKVEIIRIQNDLYALTTFQGTYEQCQIRASFE